MLKKILLILTSSYFCFASILTNASEASAVSETSLSLSGQGIGKIVDGSADLLVSGSQFTVASVRIIGNLTYITLKTTTQSTATTIDLSLHLAGHSLVAVGQSVEVSSTAAGQLLYASGKVLAFIPSKLGESLIYNQTLLG